MMPRHILAHRPAFTLIEMLVVISVVSLLVAILLPALRSAREAARTIDCLARIRQFHIVGEAYRQDFKLWFPPNNIFGSVAPWYSGTYRYAELLAPYLNLNPSDLTVGSGYYIKPNNFLICPSNPHVYTRFGNATLLRNWCNYDTYLNNYQNSVYFGKNGVSFPHDPKRSEPRSPSRVLLTAECKSSALGYVTNGVTPLIRFHPKETGNFLMVDGHAKTRSIITSTDFNDAGLLWWN